MSTLLIYPTSSRFSVPNPTHVSEFEVQAEIWARLKGLGIDVRGEVKARAPFDGCKKHHVTCRFDLVVYQESKAVLIIEVKSGKVRHKDGFDETRQGTRYPCFGLPVVVVYGCDGIDKAISYAQEIVSARKPKKVPA
ncbi:MAG: hypothetical protein KGI52_12460 [Burkholderiales bacterium]|nr:hypothetical protein [Burkholderiales bacterium]